MARRTPIPDAAIRSAGVVAALALLTIDPRTSPAVTTALSAFVAAALAASFRPHAPASLAAAGRALPWVVRLGVLAVAVAVAWPLLAGHAPATRDHGLHYLRTHVLVHDLLPEGRLVGFSERLGLGFGFGDDYPVLPYLWAAAAHLLTFGAVSLRASYAFGLGLLLLVSALASYVLAARLLARARPDAAPVVTEIAGALAALWTLLDPGGSREGGWEYGIFHGVWPQALSVPFVLAFAAALWAGPSARARRLGLAALAGAAAILAHPFALPILAAVALATAVAAAFERGSWADVAEGPLAAVWAVAASLVWLGPFVDGAAALDRHPVPWHPLARLVGDLLRGRLLDHGGSGFLAPAAAVGLTWLAVRGGRSGRAFVLAFFGLLLAASEDAVAVLRLDLVVPAVRNLQFPRFAAYLTPLLAVAGGISVAVLLDALARRTGTAGRRDTPGAPSPRAARLPLAAAAGIGIASLWTAGPPWLARPAAALDTLDDDPLAEADAALTRRIAAFTRDHGRPPRVAFLRARLSGAAYPLLALADGRACVLLFGHVPTINRRIDLRRPTPALLDALGADLVVYDGPLPRGHPLAGTLRDVERVRTLRIAPWASVREAPPATRAGPVRPTREGPGRYRVEVPPDAGHVSVWLSPHPAWRIEQGGRSLEGTRDPAGQGAAWVLGFDVAGPEPVHLAFAPAPHARRDAAATLLAVLLALVALGRRKRPHTTETTRPLGRPAAAGLAALCLVALAWASARSRANLARTWEDRTRPPTRDRRIRPVDDGERPRPEGRFVADLVLDAEPEVYVTPADPCRAIRGRDPRRGCNARAERPRRSFLGHGRHIYRCLRVTVPAGGYARLRWPLPEAAFLHVLVRRVRGSGKRLRFRVPAVHTKARALVPGTTALRIDAGRAGDRLELRFGNRDRDPATVCVAAAAFAEAGGDGG